MFKTSILILIFLALFSSLSAKDAKDNKMTVQTAYATVHSEANIFSESLFQLQEANEVRILKQVNNWYYIEYQNQKGFIHKKYLRKTLQKVNENIYKVLVKNKDNSDISSTKKNFSEEEEIAAAAKGFSEEEEIAAAAKGFSEEEEIAAAAKGFSEEEEIAAAAKGFKLKENSDADQSKKNKLNIIFKKYYSSKPEKNYKKIKKLLKKIK